MSDPYSWKELDKKTQRALEALREQVRAEYEKKITSLESELRESKEKEDEDFYVEYPAARPLQAWHLMDLRRELDPQELGRLQAAFLKRFHWSSQISLVIQQFIPGDPATNSGNYTLWLIKTGSRAFPSADSETPGPFSGMPQKEFSEALRFVQGFMACREMYRSKTKHRSF